MLKCPHGHPNPDGWQLCGECGTPLDEVGDAAGWYRAKWAVIGASGLAILVLIGSVIGFVVTGGERTVASEPATADQEILQWWAGAREPFMDLQQSLVDAQQALAIADRTAMDDACVQMHDTAAVQLQAHLATPSPELTAELAAAIDDAHAAAHMCLSVLAGSANDYNGEFPVDLDQADKHLVAAQELIRDAQAGAT